jgi:hypothetical protein
MQAPVDHRVGGGRHALQLDDRPQPEPAEHRQVKAPDVLRQVRERVGALVARVLAGVGQGTDAAGIEHDDERTAAHGPIVAQALVARG